MNNRFLKYYLFVELSSGEHPMQFIEGGIQNAIVIQPQNEEFCNLENGSISDQVQNGDSSLEIKPDEFHSHNTEESKYLGSRNEEDCKIDLKPFHDIYTYKSQSHAPHVSNDTNEMCTFRLAEYWSNNDTNKITAIYDPLPFQYAQSSNIQFKENITNNESTEHALENGDLAPDVKMTRNEEKNNLYPIDTPRKVSKNGKFLIKDEIDASQHQNPVTDKPSSNLPKKELIVQLKDISKQSKITFLEHMKQDTSECNEAGHKTNTPHRKTAKKCTNCDTWLIGKSETKTHRIKSWCMIARHKKDLKCLKCMSRFSSQNGLIRHFKSCDSQNQQGQPKLVGGRGKLVDDRGMLVDDKGKMPRNIQCLSCNQIFVGRQCFLVHFVNAHLHNLENDNGLKLEYTCTEKPVKHHCRICGKFEQSRRYLLRHFTEAHSLKVQYYNCKQCIAATCNYEELTRHWQEVHHLSSREKCGVCSKWSTTADMNKHLELQHLMFKCEKCKVLASIAERNDHNLICKPLASAGEKNNKN